MAIDANEETMSLTIASYGGGTNSTAMLIECAKRGVKVDLILFADTGGEKPHTYNYVKIFSDWLVDNNMPEIVTVKKGGRQETLEESLLRLNALPSVAYGYKTCSQKFKIQPQLKYVNSWSPAREVWNNGGKITKLVGYDAGEAHRADATIPDDQEKKYDNWYPLIDWDMGRDECIETILGAGLCLPGKSSCYFCPNSKPSEIRQLKAIYPDLMERALRMEANSDLTHIKGLGRNFAWKDVIATDDMFLDEFSQTPEMSCDCYDG
jgi:hypothetical protein